MCENLEDEIRNQVQDHIEHGNKGDNDLCKDTMDLIKSPRYIKEV